MRHRWQEGGHECAGCGQYHTSPNNRYPSWYTVRVKQHGADGDDLVFVYCCSVPCYKRVLREAANG